MYAEIEILNLPQRPRYVITPGEFLVLGRGQNADIVLPNDTSLSRLHCKIYYQKKEYWVEDLKSKNQTFVNGKAISRQRLKKGDIVQLGHHRIRFSLEKEKEAVVRPGQEPFMVLKRDDKLTGKILIKLGIMTRTKLEQQVKKQEETAQEGVYFPLIEFLEMEEAIAPSDLEKFERFKKEIPFSIPGYKLEELIGMGGMGRIYQATCLKTKHLRACKIFCDPLPGMEESLRDQFKKEARALTSLSHENIVAGIDSGESEGTLYIVMEYVDGPTLQQHIKDQGGRLLPDRALEIAIHVSRALVHAHQLGYIHRDIKPENILLTRNGIAKLCDFGLVKESSLQEREENIFGTLAYMSPEQIRSEPLIDIRSDLYCLGTVFYRMLFGRLPFVGDSKRIRLQHLNQPVRFPDEGKHFQKMELARVISKMMAKAPSDRYQTPQALLEELESLKLKFERTDIGVTEEVPQIEKSAIPSREKKKSRLWVVPAAFALCVVGFFSFQSFNGKAQQAEYLSICSAVDEKEYDQAIEKAKGYLSKYPSGENRKNVKEKWQESLFHKALQARVDKKLKETSALCAEIIQIDEGSTTGVQARSLLNESIQEIKKDEEQNSLRRKLSSVDDLMRAKEWEMARKSLLSLQNESMETEIREAWQERLSRVEENLLEKSLAPFRFYPVEELKSRETPLPKIDGAGHVAMEKILLSASKSDVQKPSGMEGYFFLQTDFYFHCLKASTGDILWSEPSSSWKSIDWTLFSGQRIVNDASIANRVLISGPGSPVMKMLSLSNGDRLWAFSLPSPASARPICYEGNLYVPCQDSYCYRIHAATGKLSGAFLTGKSVETPGAVDDRVAILYLLAQGHVYGFHLSSGKLEAYGNYEGEAIGTPWTMAGHVVFLNRRGEETLLVVASRESGKRGIEFKTTYKISGKGVESSFLGKGRLMLRTDRRLELVSLDEMGIPLEKEKVSLAWEGISPSLLSHSRLLSARPFPTIYSVSASEKEAVWEYKEPKKNVPGEPLSSWQKTEDLYFLATRVGKSYFGQAFEVSSNPRMVWQRRIGTGFFPSVVTTSSGRMWVAMKDGALVQMVPGSSGLLPRYRMKRGHPYKEISTRLVKIEGEEERFIVVRNGVPCSMLKTETGQSVSEWTLSESFEGSLAPDPCHYKSKILFLGDRQKVKIFSVVSGRKLSKEEFECSGDITAGPLFYKGSLFLGDSVGNCYRLRLSKEPGGIGMKRDWKFKMGKGIYSLALSGKLLYAGSDDGNLYALSLSDGTEAWKYDTGAAVRCNPLFIRQVAYFGNEEGQFFALGAEKGDLKWKKRLEGALRATPLEMNEKIWAVTARGMFFRLDPSNGNTEDFLSLGSGVCRAFFSFRKKAYACSDDGFVYVLAEKEVRH